MFTETLLNKGAEEGVELFLKSTKFLITSEELTKLTNFANIATTIETRKLKYGLDYITVVKSKNLEMYEELIINDSVHYLSSRTHLFSATGMAKIIMLSRKEEMDDMKNLGFSLLSKHIEKNGMKF